MGFKEAEFYRKLAGKKVHCTLCPHDCFIENGEVGKCIVRQNVDGSLKSMHYAKPHIMQYKNIENHSIYHLIPGSKCLSIGVVGENLINKNSNLNKIEEEINKTPKLGQEPHHVISEIKKTDTKTILHGFTEPILSYEYLKDISDKSPNLKHAIITKGFISADAARELSKKINAANVELISVNPEMYKQIYGVDVKSILKAIKIMKDNGVWIEISLPIISGINDNVYEIRGVISWVLNNLGTDIPIHLKFDKKDMNTKELAENIRKQAMNIGINYVYINHGREENTTFCPECKKELIIRNGNIIKNNIVDGKCTCGKRIDGVWE